MEKKRNLNTNFDYIHLRLSDVVASAHGIGGLSLTTNDASNSRLQPIHRRE